MKEILWIAMTILLTLASCSPQSNNDPKTQGVLTDTQKKALNDAKQVEKVLQEADDKNHKALDEAEGK